CQPVDHTQDVTDYGNPLFSVESPLPLLGVDSPPVALNYCAQLTAAKIDFYPGNVINLPAELNPPLPSQRFSLYARVCGGMDCPAPDFIDQIEPWPPGQQQQEPTPGRGQGDNTPAQQSVPPIVPPTRKLICFCLDAYLIGHVAIEPMFGTLTLVGHVDDVDIVDIKPDNLEDIINCYLRATVEMLLREKLTLPVVHTFLFDFNFLKLPQITVEPAPNPPIPNNPAIEDDQLKIFIDIKVGP
ncbi:MAG: hypothetical protein ACRD1J_07415, partial [Terriglobia bacterium]